MTDQSRGYDDIADDFARRRSKRIGVPEVRDWAASLGAGATVLDVACGTGEPITRAMLDAGCQVYALDASPRMVQAFAARFPDVPVRCEAIETSSCFDRQFDGVVAWGVIFLLPEANQVAAIGRLASAVAPGGGLVFTAPSQAFEWNDGLTDVPSLSLGRQRYADLLTREGLTLIREFEDEGDNHYYVAVRR